MEPGAEVIVLSDDEDGDGGHTGALDNSSVLIVEDSDESKDLSEANEVLDEDMTITFSRKASVLPHARYDCTVSFSFTDSSVSEAEDTNAAYCEQCFCYICDQLASQCKLWTVPGFCHCNAHKRSMYWKSLRDRRIMGYLHELKFTFNPADMDADLRRAEVSLQEFSHSLALKYAAFLASLVNSNPLSTCVCPCHTTSRSTVLESSGVTVGCSRCYIEHQKHILYHYTPVMARVNAFLDESMKEKPKSSVVMMLGAIKLFITHSAPGTLHAPAISQIMLDLFWRAISAVQVSLVDADFPASFIKQLQDFFYALPLPPDFRKFRNGLSMVSWDDPLLSAVLKGQNVTGVRQVKGRRLETLHEEIVVVRARVVKLQRDNRYRELARYLKVVKSDSGTMMQMMRDWIPFYLCKVGDYAGATDALFTLMYGSSCPASRLSSDQFGAYLQILMTGHVPQDIPHPPQVELGPYARPVRPVPPKDPLLSSTWTPVEGANRLKRLEVLKFALRVLNCNQAVFTRADSWVKVLKFANLSTASSSSSSPDVLCLPEPDYHFLMRTRELATGILSELYRTSRIQLPKSFQNGYPEQALLLLATQALAMRLLHSLLKPVLAVILTFKSNPWVMRWLFGSLLVQPLRLQEVLCVTLEELLNKQNNSVLQLQDTVEQFIVASFLCLFFQEPCMVLHPKMYPITELLASWNEFENPWQYHLRQMLEASESSLSVGKKEILIQMVHCGPRY